MTSDQILAALALVPCVIAALFSVLGTIGAWVWFAESHRHDQTDAFISAAVCTVVSSVGLALSAALVLCVMAIL